MSVTLSVGLGSMIDNILAVAQRESAGASTFGKYNFQYHWALCNVIEKHHKKQEYALLIEYHEDVVIADNLDGNKANFEFYQVKNQSATFTKGSLTKRVKGKKNTLKSSVLGKLLSSCIGTQYEDRITKIGLVSSSGFSLEIDGGLTLDIISAGNLTSDCLESLTADIKAELDIDLLPEHLQFIVPEVKIENQEDYVLAQFAKLVYNVFSGAQCSAVDIYRAVIDEMGRKGRIQLDYKDWNRLIENKSLTSDEVNKVLEINSHHPSATEIKEDFSILAKELGWRLKKIRDVRKKLSQLSLRRLAFMSALDISIESRFKASADKLKDTSFSNDKDCVEALISQAKSDGLHTEVPDTEDFLAEVLYCFLTS